MPWHLFSIHILTASGAALALLAVLATLNQDWQAAFVYIGLALFVDAIDGPLARRLRVSERLPKWDGAALDYVIDYTTYVFVPAIIVANAGLLADTTGKAVAVLIAVTGAIYFADRRMKQPDNSFRGFPAVWNMPVFVLFVFQPPAWITIATIIVLAVMTFLPIQFVHPNRVIRWRSLTLSVTAVRAVSAVWITVADFQPQPAAQALLLAASAYLFAVSGIQQLSDR
jgi:phosphatidylcholine synthase